MTLKEELNNRINTELSASYNFSNGRIVPSQENIGLAEGGKRLKATFLYADLANSSSLSQRFHHEIAARLIKTYLSTMCLLITKQGGIITSFDGDRVMAVFIGDSPNTKATICALKMNYILVASINPQIQSFLRSKKITLCRLKHKIGIDTSDVTVIRAGIRGSNDLVWLGKAPNFAAKLSEIDNKYMIFISENVFNVIHDSVKYVNENLKPSSRFDFALNALGLPKLSPITRPPIGPDLIFPFLSSIWQKKVKTFTGRFFSIYQSNYCYVLK